MRRFGKLARLAFALAALAAAHPAAARPDPNLPQIMLLLHNGERLAVGSPALAWDMALAAQAQAYAERLAAFGRMVHAPRAERPGQGENLASGTRGYFAAEALGRTWLAEKRYFQRGVFPAISRTGNWADAGHYSQIIWPTTTRLGCGIADGRRMTFLVCRYAPAGNRDGVRL